ncbi:MAG: plasmid pRiA4b ORF-3 family protein [Parafilimonas sp.]
MSKIFQLKFDLAYIKPAITRTVLVPEDFSFYQLHHIIQISMGWGNYHLFAFRHDNYCIEIPFEDDEFDFPGSKLKKIDPRNLQLKEYFNTPRVKIKYEYDFGDSWLHTITLQKVLDVDDKKVYPVCIKAKRNCPPEDCGGFPGYEHLAEIMQKPKHPEYKEMIEWLGDIYDPEEVDIELINEDLQGMEER